MWFWNRLTNPTNAAAYLKSMFYDLFNMLTASSPYVSTEEPPLPEYVCERYPAGGYKCAVGPLVK